MILIFHLFCVRLGKHASLKHDNASTHKSRQTATALKRHQFNDILLHPSYSSDLTPCGFFRFPKLIERFKEHRHASDNDIIQAVRSFLREKTSHFSFNRMQQSVRLYAGLDSDLLEK